MDPKGDLLVELVSIVGKKTKFLRNREILQVKVQWSHYNLEDATWESEDVMREACPHLF